MTSDKRDEELKEELKTEEEIRRELAKRDKDTNPDPLTGEPGSHPIGTGIGSATTGAVGAIVGGAVGGPIGAAAGGTIGAIVGGLAGHGAAEAVNPTEEHKYWNENYRNRPYVKDEADYEEYAPAYEFGWMAYGRHEGKTFEQAESDLEKEWETYCGSCQLRWSDARPAARESWERIAARQRQSEHPEAGIEGNH